MIYYRKDLQKFYLEPVFDNKEIFFVFVKILNPYLLTTESIAFCVLSYIFKIKVNRSNNKELIICLKPQFKNEDIGRKQGSDIELPESEISREQAMIYYEKDNWYIKDGGKEKPSGSGTWLFLEKRYEITNNIIFMVGSSTIKLEYNPPQTEKDDKKEKEIKEIKKEIVEDKNNVNINGNSEEKK